MSQRRDNQMTDDRLLSDLVRHVYQDIDRLVQTAGPSCKQTVHGQQADNCGVNYSFHTPTGQVSMASPKDGINGQATVHLRAGYMEAAVGRLA